jgi:hypothetical protein
MLHTLRRPATLVSISAAIALLSGCAALPFEGSVSGGYARWEPKPDEFEGDTSGPGFSYAITAVAQFIPIVGIEAGYVNLGQFKFDGTWSDENGVFDDVGTIDTWGIKAGARATAPLPGKLKPSAKIGVLYWDVEENETFAGMDERNSATGFDPYFGFGLEYELSGPIAIRASWEHFNGIGERDKTGRGPADYFSGALVLRLK